MRCPKAATRASRSCLVATLITGSDGGGVTAGRPRWTASLHHRHVRVAGPRIHTIVPAPRVAPLDDRAGPASGTAGRSCRRSVFASGGRTVSRAWSPALAYLVGGLRDDLEQV